jgi:hypothetical protein
VGGSEREAVIEAAGAAEGDSEAVENALDVPLRDGSVDGEWGLDVPLREGSLDCEADAVSSEEAVAPPPPAGGE